MSPDEKIVGWRRWKLALGRPVPGELYSLVTGQPWERGVNEAVCRSTLRYSGVPDHNAPGAACKCGFYANYAVDLGQVFHGWAIGAVLGWGNLQVHGDGFRAQYAEVLCLVDGPTGVGVAAERYGVPVLDPDMARAYALEHGIEMPMACLPV